MHQENEGEIDSRIMRSIPFPHSILHPLQNQKLSVPDEVTNVQQAAGRFVVCSCLLFSFFLRLTLCLFVVVGLRLVLIQVDIKTGT